MLSEAEDWRYPDVSVEVARNEGKRAKGETYASDPSNTCQSCPLLLTHTRNPDGDMDLHLQTTIDVAARRIVIAHFSFPVSRCRSFWGPFRAAIVFLGDSDGEVGQPI